VVRQITVDEPIRGAELMMRPLAETKGLTLEMGATDQPAAIGEPDRVRQVLINLLSNAIKFTPAGGRIELSCDHDQDSVHIHVRDTGRGIPSDRLADVFKPFVQVDGALTRMQEGTGLGLAISRELAQRMGGELCAASAPGEGSVFTLSLARVPR
jgi:signal transduction histidine kinase